MEEAPGEEGWRGQESWDLLHQAHLHLEAGGGQQESTEGGGQARATGGPSDAMDPLGLALDPITDTTMVEPNTNLVATLTYTMDPLTDTTEAVGPTATTDPLAATRQAPALCARPAGRARCHQQQPAHPAEVPWVDTAVLAGRVRAYLKDNRILWTRFAALVLGVSQGRLSTLLGHPRPWDQVASLPPSSTLPWPPGGPQGEGLLLQAAAVDGHQGHLRQQPPLQGPQGGGRRPGGDK